MAENEKQEKGNDELPVEIERLVRCIDLAEAIRTKKDSIAFLTDDNETYAVDCVNYDRHNDAVLVYIKKVGA